MASGAVPKDKSVEKVIWLEDIYNYLYTQKGNDPPPPIQIPSTVMLKYQRPCAWFTSSPEGELIKRSDTKELDPHVIKRQFCEGAKHDCVAYYVSYGKGAKGNRTAKIEYFDDKGLENFLLNRPKENNGIVQKFEEPTSPYNTLIRAYWTPHKLQLQQRVNKNQLSDLRVLMNERLATFDGPEHLNSEFDIKSYKLKSRVETEVGRIVAHIKKLLPSAYTLSTEPNPYTTDGSWGAHELTRGLGLQVGRIVAHIKKLLPSAYTLWTMECFFKLSGKNKLLFLWCNDLRVFTPNDPPKIEAPNAGKNKLLFLWCNDLRVFTPNDPPKIETFLAPPVNSHVAPKHKYEKKDLKKEYFKCPCAGFNIDPACDRSGGLFEVSQMKITTYRYMILYHQSQVREAPYFRLVERRVLYGNWSQFFRFGRVLYQMKITTYRCLILYHQSQAHLEKDVAIPEDVELVKLSPYRKKWIEEDEMVKFRENADLKAYELKSGSLVYQMPRYRDHVRELNGWEQIPPLPVSNADPLVFKFLSKLAIVDGQVLQSHPVNEYSKQDIQDFRRFFHNIVMKNADHDSFLERKMKVCDACCIKFTSSADDNISLEMTKLVVGTPNDTFFSTRKSMRSSMSSSKFLDPAAHSFKAFQSEPSHGMLPALTKQGSGRPPRSKTSLGFNDKKHAEAQGEDEEGPRSNSVMEGGERPGDAGTDGRGRGTGSLAAIGGASTASVGGGNASLSMSLPSKSAGRMHSKNVRDWIQFFYQEADLRASAAARAASKKSMASPYEMPLPFRE